MDIVITTTDPHEISIEEIREALDKAGYVVASITVLDREGNLDSVARY